MVTHENISFTSSSILKKKNISSGELIFLLDARERGLTNFMLIDIRESSEHKIVSIDGTDILFPVSKMHLYPEVVEQLRHENFVMYCSTGNKTAHFSKMVLKMGFVQFAQLKGGIITYKGATSRNVVPPNIF